MGSNENAGLRHHKIVNFLTFKAITRQFLIWKVKNIVNSAHQALSLSLPKLPQTFSKEYKKCILTISFGSVF